MLAVHKEDLLEEPPELPSKVKVGGKSHSELQQIVYATRESLRDFSHRSRGGEADYDKDFNEEDLGGERSGQESSEQDIITGACLRCLVSFEIF